MAGNFGRISASVQNSQGLLLATVLAIFSLLGLGLILVWTNIERTKLAYSQIVLEKELVERRIINARLATERDNLLSPKYLGDRAEGLGLYVAKPGQIRRIEQGEKNLQVKEVQ